MGFEPTTFRDPVERSDHWATGDSGEQGWNVGLWLELHRAVTQPNCNYLAHLNKYITQSH